MIVQISAFRGPSRVVADKDVLCCRADFVRYKVKAKRPANQYQPIDRWMVETITSKRSSPISWRTVG